MRPSSADSALGKYGELLAAIVGVVPGGAREHDAPANRARRLGGHLAGLARPFGSFGLRIHKAQTLGQLVEVRAPQVEEPPRVRGHYLPVSIAAHDAKRLVVGNHVVADVVGREQG